MSNHQSCLGQQMCDVAKITKARAQWWAATCTPYPLPPPSFCSSLASLALFKKQVAYRYRQPPIQELKIKSLRCMSCVNATICVREQIYVVSVSKVMVKCLFKALNSCGCSLSRVELMKLEGLLKMFTHMFEKARLIKKGSCKRLKIFSFVAKNCEDYQYR